MTIPNEQPPTALPSQNGGIKVKEYIAPYGDHASNRRLLSLIDGQWLSEEAWQKQAEEQLNMDYCTFYTKKKELERSGCVAEFGRHYAAILVQIPVAHFEVVAVIPDELHP